MDNDIAYSDSKTGLVRSAPYAQWMIASSLGDVVVIHQFMIVRTRVIVVVFWIALFVVTTRMLCRHWCHVSSLQSVSEESPLGSDNTVRPTCDIRELVTAAVMKHLDAWVGRDLTKYSFDVARTARIPQRAREVVPRYWIRRLAKQFRLPDELEGLHSPDWAFARSLKFTLPTGRAS